MKILVIDDHPVVRQGIVTVLKSIGADTHVLEADTTEQALEVARTHPDLDVVIVDIFMPGTSGWTAISLLGQTRPDVPVLVMSSSEEPQHMHRAISLGALGYVPKSASADILLSAIEMIMDGETYVPVLTGDVTPPSPQRLPYGNVGNRGLTPRQIDVLRLLAEGISNKVIARRLELSEKTVKVHISAIFKALNVLNRSEAVVAGKNFGLIEHN